MKVIRNSKQVIKNSKRIIILYTIIGILVALLLLSPLLDSSAETFWQSRILLYAKILLTLWIALLILKNLFYEMIGFIESYEIKQSSIKNYKWIIKRENLSIFIRSILLLTPFITLSFYSISAATNSTDFYNIHELLEKATESISNLKFFDLEFIINKFSVLILSGLISIIFGSIVFVFYKISMKLFYEDINHQLKIISKNAKSYEKFKQMFEDNYLFFARESDDLQKAFLFERKGKILNLIKCLESDKWKEVKKSTCPPLFRLNKYYLV